IRHALVKPMIVQEVPRITSSPEASGYLGLPFTFQVTTAFSGGAGVREFSATDLPSGLEIDVDSGLIFGRPEAVGAFSSWVAVSNENGTTSALWRLTVKDPFEE